MVRRRWQDEQESGRGVVGDPEGGRDPDSADLNEVVAYNFKRARDLYGWTQDEVADRSSASSACVCRSLDLRNRARLQGSAPRVRRAGAVGLRLLLRRPAHLVLHPSPGDTGTSAGRAIK